MADVPQQTPDGQWQWQGLTFATNAAAWRHIDRASNEPISRAQDTSDWAFKQMANRNA